ncbi:MAG: condensation domain-containing protein [Ardenticatenaceae bacterium]
MNFNKIESIYPLSPMQEGMLFHSLYAPRSGVDIEQLVMGLHEALNVSAFREAWQRVVALHPVLRTCFRWEGVEEPLQEVHGQVCLPMIDEDWRECSSAEQGRRLDAYLRADRARGFVLAEAPLMRVAVFRLAEADYRCVWTFPHILLDGRSFPIVLKDLFAFYEAECAGNRLDLEPPRPYQDHIEWLQKQDFAQAEGYWRQTLKGLMAPTSLAVDQKGAAQGRHLPTVVSSHGLQEVRLSEGLTSALRSLAEAHDLTLNTMLQGAWALLLSRYSGEDAEGVVFGTVRAGRWNSIKGAESMVGLFINTLPMRIRVNPDMSVLAFLKEVRAQHLSLREPLREHCPLAKIQEWSELPSKTPLFDSILAYERYTINEMLQAATKPAPGEGERGRVGEWESGRTEEGESGRVGEPKRGRVGEWESGSRGNPLRLPS